MMTTLDDKVMTKMNDTPSKTPQKPQGSATTADTAADTAAAASTGDMNKDGVPPDVRVESLSDLPTLPSNARVSVYYVEQIIKELGTVGELLETYHSGLTFYVHAGKQPWRGNGAAAAAATSAAAAPSEFTLQFYALDFPLGPIVPRMQGDDDDESGDMMTCSPYGMIWTNAAAVHYTPAVDPHRWTKGRRLVGTITGDIFNQHFAAWTVQFSNQRGHYQLFDVWDGPSLGESTCVWKGCHTCGSYTEAALVKLYNLGGEFRGVGTDVLRRSYFALISKTKPMVIDMANDVEGRQRVRRFYSRLREAITGGLSTPEFLRLLADDIEVFIVYDSACNEYLQVKLDPPYLALAQMYQPMKLPWQDFELVSPSSVSTRDDHGNEKHGNATIDSAGDFATDMSNAASGVVDILRRRLPPVLGRRLWPNKVLVGSLAVAAVAVLLRVAGNVDLVNESFVAGLGIGLVVGMVVGSQML